MISSRIIFILFVISVFQQTMTNYDKFNRNTYKSKIYNDKIVRVDQILFFMFRIYLDYK